MPIYEYQCQKCGQIKEAFQKFSDEPLTVCSCGGQLKKLMSLNSFHLKGSGWYVTDYGRGKGNQSSAARDKTNKTETKKDETSSSD
ncbi:MAG: zinc ribbon domain-containing protein [Deltaproteobacteria bacterium]|nr:zinc ribbon domain-containing protein [Deltaproteobacteria bacterium]